MSSPIFHIRVLAKQRCVLRLQIFPVTAGGFDVTDQRDVLKAVGYGGDFLFPDGRQDHGWEDRSVIARELDFESQLWNDAWVEANASRYVADARVLAEDPHPSQGGAAMPSVPRFVLRPKPSGSSRRRGSRRPSSRSP